jgi:hypothetical protein
MPLSGLWVESDRAGVRIMRRLGLRQFALQVLDHAEAHHLDGFTLLALPTFYMLLQNGRDNDRDRRARLIAQR